MLRILDSPRIYCGKGKMPANGVYLRKGSPLECLKKGFGAGLAQNSSQTRVRRISAIEIAKWANKAGVSLVKKNGEVKSLKQVVQQLSNKIGQAQIVKK